MVSRDMSFRPGALKDEHIYRNLSKQQLSRLQVKDCTKQGISFGVMKEYLDNERPGLNPLKTMATTQRSFAKTHRKSNSYWENSIKDCSHSPSKNPTLSQPDPSVCIVHTSRLSSSLHPHAAAANQHPNHTKRLALGSHWRRSSRLSSQHILSTPPIHSSRRVGENNPPVLMTAYSESTVNINGQDQNLHNTLGIPAQQPNPLLSHTRRVHKPINRERLLTSLNKLRMDGGIAATLLH
jgi:DNA-binding transcriptional MerR regulator